MESPHIFFIKSRALIINYDGTVKPDQSQNVWNLAHAQNNDVKLNSSKAESHHSHGWELTDAFQHLPEKCDWNHARFWAPSMISKWQTRRAFRFELVAHDSGFITEKPRRATGVEPATPGIQVCVSASRSCALVPRAIVAWLGADGWTAPDGWLHVISAPLQRMDRMGRTDQLARCSAGRYLTFDPAEVTGCSATLYATDTRQPAQLHSLRAGRLSSPTPPHYAYVCVLRWDLWAVRGPCLAVVEHVLRMRGRPGRRGGSKACLGVGASYHWYPWDLYIWRLKWVFKLQKCQK